jgi:hypothetical protein
MATAVCGSANRAAPDQFQGCAEIRRVKGSDVVSVSPTGLIEATDYVGQASLAAIDETDFKARQASAAPALTAASIIGCSSSNIYALCCPDEVGSASLTLRSGRLRRLLRRRILLRYRLAGRWRILRRLIRLLVRSRLIWRLGRSLYLTPGRMQFLVKVFSRLAKFVHALPQAPRQFGKFLGTEQDQHYYQN